jgi:hypothetical protein
MSRLRTGAILVAVGTGRLWHIWTDGEQPEWSGPVHVSMNDYLVHRPRDFLAVGRAGLRFRRHWGRTPGTLGLWVAWSTGGRRQISVSLWRSPAHLDEFVRSPAHRRVMHAFGTAGVLYTTAWTADRLDRSLVWEQAQARLRGEVAGIPHH